MGTDIRYKYLAFYGIGTVPVLKIPEFWKSG